MKKNNIDGPDSLSRMPTHVSIIMDGNGRWALQRGLKRSAGHVVGVESVRACLEEAVALGVKYLSLYAFSEENWNRPDFEVSDLMCLMAESMVKELTTMLQNGIRFIVLGNRARLDPDLNRSIDDCMEKTADDKNLTLVIFLSYSGQWDILQAAKKFAVEYNREPDRRDELMSCDTNYFSKFLVTNGIPNPDLIIRTSGEMRISNYLLWQGAYSELYFTDVLWPDFRREDFRKAVDEYSKRDRRYGKVK